MNPEELHNYVLELAAKINEITSKNPITGLGYAIPIPEKADEETKNYVDKELTNLSWNFERIIIRNKEYFVLFPC